MGNHLPAAAPQLHRPAAYPLERPAFELHYPHMVETLRREAHTGHRDSGKGGNHELAAVEGDARATS